MASDDDLFRLLPWQEGKVHTRALRWLLEQPRSRQRLLDSVLPRLELDVSQDPDLYLEAKVTGTRNRADLAYCIPGVKLAIETKVEDALRENQLTMYRDAGYVPVAFLPTVTGWLHELAEPNTPRLCAHRLFGEHLVGSLSGEEFPEVLKLYLRKLDTEQQRFRDAVKAVRQGTVPRLDALPEPRTGARPEDLLAIAWIRAVYDGLEERGYELNACEIRELPYDRGIFLGDSYTPMGSAGMFLEVLTPRGEGARGKVCVKIGGGGTLAERGSIFDSAMGAGPGPAWKRGQRRLTRGTVSVWTREETDPSAATEAVRDAHSWLKDLAGT